MSETQAIINNGPVPDRGAQVFGGTLATLIIATVFVTGRLISRYFVVGKISWDDKVMMLAWLVAFFLSFTIILGTTHGLGRHDRNIDEDQRAVLRRCEYIFSILYVSIRAVHSAMFHITALTPITEPCTGLDENKCPDLLPSAG